MTKEEKIKDLEFLNEMKKNVDEMVGGFDLVNLQQVQQMIDDWIHDLNTSQSESENNNGWIKIESEEDLPKLTIEYYVLKNGSLTTAYYRGNNRWIIPENDYPKTTEIHKITHYQPIEKPKPPIY